jgi:RNA polymerase sigma-70 factor (ECF subfamily)
VPRTPTSAELDAWVLETAPRATAFARSLLRDADRADDVVQDCYCRLLAKVAVYDLPRDGLKLLLTAISNACINATTRRKPMFRLSRPDDGEADDPPDATALPADATAAANELSAAVATALATLPPRQRAAVELKGLGYSQQEIGEMLGVSASNAGVLIHRGRQALAEKLAPYLEPRPPVSG